MSGGVSMRGVVRAALILCACVLGAFARAQPVFELDGYRWVREQVIERAVEAALPEGVDTMDVSAIETVLFQVHAALVSDGYPNAQYTVRATRRDGTVMEVGWQQGGLLDLPQSTDFTAVRVEVDAGLLHYFGRIEVTGLSLITAEQVRGYFYNTGYLFETRRRRPYSEARLRSGLRNIVETLVQAGYQDARGRVEEIAVDDVTGAVAVRLHVEEGPRHLVESVGWRVANGSGLKDPGFPVFEAGRQEPYTLSWVRQIRRAYLNVLFAAGYPDADVDVRIVDRREFDDTVRITVEIVIDPGEQVRVRELQLEGLEHTREAFVRSRIGMEAGDRFDRLAIDRARGRLAALGIFDTIAASDGGESIADDAGLARDLVFEFTERDRMRVDLLFGFGSYERLRAGMEVSQRNLFGLAHSQRLKAVQSMKSSRGEYVYSVPMLFGRELSADLSMDGLLREEVSFERREYGGSLQLEARMALRGGRIGAGYRLERLESEGIDARTVEPLTESRVGSLLLFHSLNRYDNVLYPRSGFQYRVDAEWSAAAFGADVDFVRLSANASTVYSLGEYNRVHFGVSTGIIDAAEAGDLLPLNKRFFLGGENSIRGWRQGDAAPVDAFGNVIGAEAFSLFQLEFEQEITPSLSVALFTDNLWMSAEAGDWPGTEWLGTVGVGLRYRTVVGPIRLEFGYNFEKRSIDSDYAILLGVGHPF